MKLQEYIDFYHEGKSNWFVDEVKRQWHIDRIDKFISIKEYLAGNHKIRKRVDENYNGKMFETRKVVLNYAKTIMSFETSFLMKNPTTLICDDADTLKEFKNIYKASRYRNMDYRILEQIVKFGECFEYVYLDEKNNIKSRLIPVEDSYPVYNETGTMIGFIEFFIFDGVSYYTVYTENTVEKYSDKGGELFLIGQYSNLSGLPVVYRTDNELDNLSGTSSLEDYIDILDNMEYLLSKYLDSFYKFLNPIPVMKGTKLNVGADGEGGVNPDVAGYVLQIDDTSEFNLINNKMDYQSLKELYNILRQALLDTSMTPAVSVNSQDISNLSEVSIKLLFSLASIKGTLNSQILEEGFIDRWDKMKDLLSILGKEVDGIIECTFDMAIPQNEKEIIENIKTLREIGSISLERTLEVSPYIYDVGEEMNRIKSEKMGVKIEEVEDNNFV